MHFDNVLDSHRARFIPCSCAGTRSSGILKDGTTPFETVTVQVLCLAAYAILGVNLEYEIGTVPA